MWAKAAAKPEPHAGAGWRGLTPVDIGLGQKGENISTELPSCEPWSVFEFLPEHGAVHGVREAHKAAIPFHPRPPAQRLAAGPPHPL